ncbi:hypothetical protein AWZ03_008871 [Drosophila navojoa]|uniref:LRRCT domain-containing protein n=1 Tax=Drosophila navojoa TaxID=7232 RepID=A0A484B9M0_DRONA|nr:uncharacterized protein LOC108652805 [Drosophila navojoa]TDG44730.1 hypothetical protein AWZ03_008871 [Drosophila navojoa]
MIYLAISNIKYIQNGAFGGGIFYHIMLEELQLEQLNKDVFANISSDLKEITIIQHNRDLESIHPEFLDNMIFQIEYLRLEVGIDCIRNVTGIGHNLGAIVHADFSHNNFADKLLEDTFKKLTMVERLFLSHSNIMYLPSYIFQGMKYLKLLDISNNKLITISKTIFGIQKISPNLKIYANNNNWHCDCQLQQEMDEIFVYQNDNWDMICASPEEFLNYSVFDERICKYDSGNTAQSPPMITTTTTTRLTTTTTPFWSTTTTRTTTMMTTRTMTATNSKSTTWRTTTTPTTTTEYNFLPTISTASTVNPSELVPMKCSASTNNVRWPQIDFIPTYFGGVTVKISVEQSDSQSSVGAFWFSKTTKEYYKMEMLPDEFGLGCYFTIPLQTIVTNLAPNAAYTFCLVVDGHNTVSPFSCKSVKVGSNLNTYYNSWSPKRMLAKGISLMVLGVVVFMLIGIMSMYLVLKKKPGWLKGSKRIVKPKHNSDEIIVLPRSKAAQKFHYKEKSMTQHSSQHRFCSFLPRRNSMESVASSDSYINQNVYEVIPTYITFDKIPQVEAPAQPSPKIFNNYQSRSALPHRESVRYAQISPRTKRISSDPLPSLPIDL